MARAVLTVDLDAVAANWRALDALTGPAETGVVVKADAYGLGVAHVAPTLWAAGARSYFVALAEEGAALRRILGDEARIFVFSGLMPGDEGEIAAHDLIALLNSPAQVEAARKLARRRGAPLRAGLQIDTGMNRLGLAPAELTRLLNDPDGLGGLDLVHAMSHLACADAPEDPRNRGQLESFQRLTAHPRLASVSLGLAATGGVLLGADYNFDIARPGIGLYGGAPYREARPVVTLDAPIIQIRDVAPGEAVGYGAAWTAERPSRIAVVSAGYADGLIRRMGGAAVATVDGVEAPLVGRVSMDLIALDVTGAPQAGEGGSVRLLGPERGIDALAEAAGTIGYEILTALGSRYRRRYKGG